MTERSDRPSRAGRPRAADRLSTRIGVPESRLEADRVCVDICTPHTLTPGASNTREVPP
jgi:hypothetical protein